MFVFESAIPVDVIMQIRPAASGRHDGSGKAPLATKLSPSVEKNEHNKE
jgi:hypothetical protein